MYRECKWPPAVDSRNRGENPLKSGRCVENGKPI